MGDTFDQNDQDLLSAAPPLVVSAPPPAFQQLLDGDVHVWCLSGLSLPSYIARLRSLGHMFHGVHFNASYPEWTLWDNPSDPPNLHAQHQEVTQV